MVIAKYSGLQKYNNNKTLFLIESNEEISGLLKKVIHRLESNEKELKELKSKVAELQTLNTHKDKERPKISKVVRVSYFLFLELG